MVASQEVFPEMKFVALVMFGIDIGGNIDEPFLFYDVTYQDHNIINIVWPTNDSQWSYSKAIAGSKVHEEKSFTWSFEIGN